MSLIHVHVPLFVENVFSKFYCQKIQRQVSQTGHDALSVGVEEAHSPSLTVCSKDQVLTQAQFGEKQLIGENEYNGRSSEINVSKDGQEKT